MLITLDELKIAMDIELANTDEDDKLTQAIEGASVAVQSYTDRLFDTTQVTETRSWRWDPRETILNIDDAIAITEVRINGETVPEEAWMALPFNQRWPFFWLELPPFAGGSPEMGFTRNMDKLWQKYVSTYQTVEVDGTWGWNTVPADVKQAVIYTAAVFVDNPTPYVSESIESYSYLRQNPLKDAVPQRAKDLLGTYMRPLM